MDTSEFTGNIEKASAHCGGFLLAYFRVKYYILQEYTPLHCSSGA